MKNLSKLIDDSEKLDMNPNFEQKDDGKAIMHENVINKIFRVKPHIKAKNNSVNDKNLSK